MPQFKPQTALSGGRSNHKPLCGQGPWNARRPPGTRRCQTVKSGYWWVVLGWLLVYYANCKIPCWPTNELWTDGTVNVHIEAPRTICRSANAEQPCDQGPSCSRRTQNPALFTTRGISPFCPTPFGNCSDRPVGGRTRGRPGALRGRTHRPISPCRLFPSRPWMRSGLMSSACLFVQVTPPKQPKTSIQPANFAVTTYQYLGHR